MRVFYIFNIKQEFKYLYKNHPLSLFNLLRKIYQLKENELMYGKTLLHQLINPFDKIGLDNTLFIRLHQDMPYSKRKDIHYMNNLYKNEVSRLEVKTTHIKLEVENNYSSFFLIFKELDMDLFVCDFEHFEYFFILEDKKPCLSA